MIEIQKSKATELIYSVSSLSWIQSMEDMNLCNRGAFQGEGKASTRALVRFILGHMRQYQDLVELFVVHSVGDTQCTYKQ